MTIVLRNRFQARLTDRQFAQLYPSTE
ncbi:protein of unknown function [Methylorubrum extorquens]|uniref:Uncharacterized protein n=1 Tax=Methylorubrum extorquens TaxID=408 RepID=A0A2N9AMG1_METEX|nr:protein of unknown function [Methylorubrum extorquens]